MNSEVVARDLLIDKLSELVPTDFLEVLYFIGEPDLILQRKAISNSGVHLFVVVSDNGSENNSGQPFKQPISISTQYELWQLTALLNTEIIDADVQKILLENEEKMIRKLNELNNVFYIPTQTGRFFATGDMAVVGMRTVIECTNLSTIY